MIPHKPSTRTKSRRPQATKEARSADAIAALDRLQPDSPKAKRILSMLRGWLSDESGYDEKAWPLLRRALDRERSRVGARKLFDA
jgi:hypothetical protein